ncbi:MAG: RNA-binding S4 domain-containing protein [Steroidobacteraceae bacterium]
MAPHAAAKSAPGDRHRVDRWLWFARFYRTRSLAAQAVAGGRVQVNGLRAKPARELAVGDRLDITLGAEVWTVVVRSLPSRRGPAAVAQACFAETPDSELRRRVARERRQSARALKVAPPGRPDKRERRAIRRLHGRADT